MFRHRRSASRARAFFCGYTRHATALGDPFGRYRRGERGRSQLAEADLRARCKAGAHLFHERPRRAPRAACNRRGTHIGSLILPVGCLVAPLHRPGSSRKPAPRESACFVAAHAGPRVARARDDIEIYDRPSKLALGSQTVRFCAPSTTLRGNVSQEGRIERRVYPNSRIA